MVYTMKEEVQSEECTFVGKILVEMEQEPMHPVLQYSPDDVSNDETDGEFRIGRYRDLGEQLYGEYRVHKNRRERRAELQD